MTTDVRVITLIALSAALSITQAQTNQTAKAPPAAPPLPALSAIDKTIKDLKNPTPWLNWGADLRLRNEYLNNAQTLTSDPSVNPNADLHSQDYFRFRTRVWTTITPIENLGLNARVASEPREWMEPSSSGTYLRQSGLEWRYGIVDNLNIQWNKPADLPVSLKVGRQDFIPGTPSGFGDGWLTGDGTPIDGSWTFFLDAARMTVNLEDQKTTIDVAGILQYAQPDAWLPTIGSSTTAGSPNRYTLTDQNEKGAIVWVNNRSVREANLDGYFFYKNDNRVGNPPPGATSAANGLGTYANGDNANMYTLGGRVSGPINDHWRYSAEGAYQFGRKQDPRLNGANGNNPLLAPSAETSGYRDLNAFGVNSRLSYLFNDEMANQVFLSYEFLSGDKPGTMDDEMFDIQWGRWPRWSELYNIYSYIPEARVGQTANIWRLGPGYSISPTRRMNFSLNYNALFANQDVPTRAIPSSAFSQTGSFRGHYLQAILRYRFSDHLSAHLWSEFVFMGNYYTSEQTMTFLRAEVMLTF